MIEQAQQVLNNNWREKFTIPCDKLYPFQWKWDSGFIAIGLAHFDLDRAQTELSSLLAAQWKNGMIPHIVFHNESDTYFPGKDFHQSNASSNSNPDYPSTGLVQPPVLGFVMEELFHIAKDKESILNYIDKEIDKVFENHRYFYEKRDVHNEGLVYIYHNWESGTDNSPLWDTIFEDMESPSYEFERRDTSHVDPSQRPTKREYDHYLYIIDIAKKHRYDDAKIAELSPFLVQDPLFNALLIRSNESLIRLYELLGRGDKKRKTLMQWNSLAIDSFNKKLWNDELAAYVYYDLRNDRQLPYVSSSSFSSLLAGIPTNAQADSLIKTLKSRFGGEEYYLCASYDPSDDAFKPKKYWRGPVWINMNWILYNGLMRYKEFNLADRVKRDSIELVEKCGFYEYFDPRRDEYQKSPQGLGGANFSWTAALILDFLHR